MGTGSLFSRDTRGRSNGRVVENELRGSWNPANGKDFESVMHWRMRLEECRDLIHFLEGPPGLMCAEAGKLPQVYDKWKWLGEGWELGWK